jgi:peptide chain release factor 1
LRIREDDRDAAREMMNEASAGERDMLATEIESAGAEIESLEEQLRELMLPVDPHDGRKVIVEIRGAEGGEEANLFARDLFEMYEAYAARNKWRLEVLGSSPSDMGGLNEITFELSGATVWRNMKFEGGPHRVQRVPVTESQGRIHTSAVGVLVMPEVEDQEDVELDPNDLKIDVFRSSGPGGQSVNTTDSAIRVTHLPTGVVVSCQNEKSQLQNKESALRVLRARLHQMAVDEAEAEASAQRRSQVRTVDRSERIRTYNFPENRIADHRTGFKAYNLDQVLDGDLDPVVTSAMEADEAARLAGLADAAS